MGGAGPYVGFNPKVRLRRQSSETAAGGNDKDDQLHAEEAYQRAIPFLTRWKEELVSEHGYEDLPLLTDDDLFAVSNPMRYPSVAAGTDQRRIFKLPKTAEGFASSSSLARDRVFTSLHAKRPNRNSTDQYIDEVPPLQNIFYLLQTMFDEMLVLVREDEIDDYGEITYTRVLPRKEWIQHNSDIVKIVLGLSSTAKLEQDAQNKGTRLTHDGWSYSGYDDHGCSSDEPDYTACGLECGYCGKCSY